MNLLDLLIIAVLGLFVLAGLHKGFMYTALNTICIIVCLMLAFLIMPLVSQKVTANEKIFNSADRMLNTTDSTRYFLYGGTNRLSTLRNSFIFYGFYSKESWSSGVFLIEVINNRINTVTKVICIEIDDIAHFAIH